MTDTIAKLPDDPQLLKRMLSDSMAVIENLKSENQRLLEQFRLAQHKQYGASSEAYPGQASLFDEAEETVVEAEPEKETVSYTRSKPKRKPLPADLPREVVVHDISEAEKICDCGHAMHRMGEDKSEKLEFIPAQVKVIEHVRPKYSCRHCENHGIKVIIKQAPMPASSIPKGIATPSLLSQIITSKYQYGLPLYRQEKMFKQHGIELSRKTMADWIIRGATLFKPLYDKLHEVLLQQSVIQADETTLQVINEDKTKCYMWVYCTGTDSPDDSSPLYNIVLYDYQRSRAGQCVVDYLQGYDGYLQVDGYAGYEQASATLAGCWAHVRRKYNEAKAAQPKGKTGKADAALSDIQKLYRIEKQLEGKSVEEKRAHRQQFAVPILNKLKAWLDKSVHQVPPETALGKALQYNLKQWDKLVCYVEDGNLNIDNNRSERAIKPFVIGRKNWLFSNTTSGANSSAMLYSMIETAKANGLIPFNYIMYCLEKLPQDGVDIESLLPWNVKLDPV